MKKLILLFLISGCTQGRITSPDGLKILDADNLKCVESCKPRQAVKMVNFWQSCSCVVEPQ